MSSSSSSRPRIVLDARPLSHPQAGGFRTYVRSLLIGLGERWGRCEPDLTLICYLDRPLDAAMVAIVPPGVETRILSISRLKADLHGFGQQVRRDKPDLVHGVSNYLPPLRGVLTTLTVHDAMGIKTYPWESAARWTPRDRLVNRYWYALTLLSVRRARRIVTVSDGSAREIGGALGQSANRFAVVYNGIALPRPHKGVRRQENTVLCFHAPDSRKNGEAVYRAFSEYRDLLTAGGRPLPCLEIVCTGAKTVARARDALRAWNITQYRLHEGLDDQALSNAYAGASLFVWPSRLEGFGMPPLEAMQAGCPVISSRAPVMPEVLDDAPVYFNPDQPEELARKISALLADTKQRHERAERGLAVAARYTCRRMADETVAVWRAALGTA